MIFSKEHKIFNIAAFALVSLFFLKLRPGKSINKSRELILLNLAASLFKNNISAIILLNKIPIVFTLLRYSNAIELYIAI